MSNIEPTDEQWEAAAGISVDWKRCFADVFGCVAQLLAHREAALREQVAEQLKAIVLLRSALSGVTCATPGDWVTVLAALTKTAHYEVEE